MPQVTDASTVKGSFEKLWHSKLMRHLLANAFWGTQTKYFGARRTAFPAALCQPGAFAKLETSPGSLRNAIRTDPRRGLPHVRTDPQHQRRSCGFLLKSDSELHDPLRCRVVSFASLSRMFRTTLATLLQKMCSKGHRDIRVV